MRKSVTYERKEVRFRLALLCSVCVFLFAPLADAAVWYVDKDNASGIENGTSWATAFTTIQTAIDWASVSGGDVWVAEGTYSERRTSPNEDGTANDTGSIVMKSGVHIYGGFLGNEANLEDRDWSANVTTLDGATSRDATQLPAYHVIIGADNSTLDGFTVTGGNANAGVDHSDDGGGLFNFSASPTVKNCTFTANHATGGGGAIANKSGSSPVIENCVFSNNNNPSFGGAIYNLDSSSPEINDCHFESNKAQIWGGAIRNENQSEPVVTNSHFVTNLATRSDLSAYGGAVSNDSSSPTFRDCFFTSNIASGNGFNTLSGPRIRESYGGAMHNVDSSPILENCEFSNNQTQGAYNTEYGGAIYNLRSSPDITDCDFTGNRSGQQGGAIYNSASSPTLTDCLFTSNSVNESQESALGGGICNVEGSAPILLRCTFDDNVVKGNGFNTLSGPRYRNAFGGGMYNSSSTPTLTDCHFVNNRTDGSLNTERGGGLYNIDSSPILVGCTFTSNTGNDDGGGVYNEGISSPVFTNCTFASNVSNDGAGMHNNGSSPRLTNCNFSNNTSNVVGGALSNSSASPTLINCTFSGNTATSFGGAISNSISSKPSFKRCLFNNNSAGTRGGGMDNDDSAPVLTNCVFSENDSTSSGGGAISNTNASNPRLLNCTLSKNTAGAVGGGGIFNSEDSVTIVENSILWGDSPNETFGGTSEFSFSTVQIADIESQGEGNVSSNPLFVNPASNNFHLQIGSPSVNTARSFGAPAIDIETNARPNGLGVDIGAYEFDIESLPDADNDDLPDDWETLVGTNPNPGFADTDSDGLSDGWEVFNGLDPLSNDANGDLDGDGLSNADEFAAGTNPRSADTDGDGLSDKAEVDLGSNPLNPDSDGDGLLDGEDSGQGLDPTVADATFFVTIDHPSQGATFLESDGDVTLSGRVSSSLISSVVVSTDGGVTFPHTNIVFDGRDWSYVWTPTSASNSEPFQLKARGMTILGSAVESELVDVFMSDELPRIEISSPIQGEHVQGLVEIEGSASAQGSIFFSYNLEFAPGNDPATASGFQTITTSSTEVSDGVLSVPPWDTSGLADGSYVLRLTATDFFQVHYTTAVVEVDSDSNAPNPPSTLSIAGRLDLDVVSDGVLVDVMGMAESGSSIEKASLVDGATLNEIVDITSDLVVHKFGLVRGTITMPSLVNVDQVAVRVSVQDPVGNVSPLKTSNFLLVDNDAPEISIEFPLAGSTMAPSAVQVTGTAQDVGVSGLALVEFSSDGTNWTPASGTENWTANWTATSGTHELWARATDETGNIETISNAGIVVDATKPEAFITSPLAGSSINDGDTVNLIGTANHGDWVGYALYYAEGGDPEAIPGSSWNFVTPASAGPVVNDLLATWTPVGLSDAIHVIQLRVQGRDAQSNLVNSVFNMLVDIDNPLALNGIPNVTVTEGSVIDDVYLPDYASASIGDVTTMMYTILDVSGPPGVVFDVDSNPPYLSISPDENFYGEVDITIEVDNGSGLTDDDTFTVNVLPVNDTPTAPTVYIDPSSALDGDDLVANVTVPSNDIEGQTVTYRYDWSKSTNGILFGDILQSTETTATSDTLLSSDTTPGETWRVVVTPNDGFVNGDPGASQANIVIPSSISIDVDKNAITLGDTLTLSGGITPSGPGESVFFDTTITPPGGSDTAPTSTNTNSSSNYTRDFTPNEAGNWKFFANWYGNTDLKAAMSGQEFVTVAKSQPTLTLALSAASGANPFTNLTAWATIDAPLGGSLRSLLEGRPITLFMREPGATTDSSSVTATTAFVSEGEFAGKYVAEFTPADFANAGVSFDIPGTWKFVASYQEVGGNFKAATSPNFDSNDVARLTVKDGAGYAVLIVGSIDDTTGVANGLGEGQIEHTKTMDNVYRVMNDRGFAPEDIFYIREPTGQSLPQGVLLSNLDPTPSKFDFRNAITSWALNKMNANPAPLYIVMIDHGLPDKFFIYNGNSSDPFGPSRVLEPDELDGWLDNLQVSLNGTFGDGTPDEAADQEIVVVYGACYAGSFIEDDPNTPVVDSISGDGRIIVAASQPDELSHRGGVDAVDNVRDGELFTTEFFRELGVGSNLKDAFEAASTRVEEFTLSRSNSGDPDAVAEQMPILDDNGDATGTVAGDLSVSSGLDGARAFTLELGFGETNAVGSVGLLQVSPTTQLLASDSLPQFFAKPTNPSTSHEAWIEIKDPNYLGSTAADEQQTSAGGEDLSLFQREVDMLQFDSDQADDDDNDATNPLIGGNFTWTDTLMDRTNSISLANAMSQPGTYQLYYFIRDNGTGEVSSFLITNVQRDASDNDPPSPPTLLLPTNGSIEQPPVLFAWTSAFDPDGDAVTYRLEIDREPDLNTPTNNLLTKENIAESSTDSKNLFNPFSNTNEALIDGASYYWRIVAIDFYGAESVSVERNFTIDTPNNLPGILRGKVKDSLGNVVPGYNVTPSSPNAPTVVPAQYLDGNYYASQVQVGTYSITVTAPGFTTQIKNNIIVSENSNIVTNFVMQSDDGGTDPYDDALDLRNNFDALDMNNDGKLSLAESGLSGEIFNLLDTNNDNSITMDELLGATLGSADTATVVWADFDRLNPGTENGTELAPFNTFLEASEYVASQGIVRIFNSDSAESPTISKAMIIESSGGVSRLGTSGSLDLPMSLTQSDEAEAGVSAENMDSAGRRSTGTGIDYFAEFAEHEFGAAVFERVMPSSVDADGNRIASVDATLAIRLRDFNGIQLESLWAELYPEKSADELRLEWIPATDESGTGQKDIWVMFAPNQRWMIGELIEFIAGGVSNAEHELLSQLYSVRVVSPADNREGPDVSNVSSNGLRTYVYLVDGLPNPDGIDPPAAAFRIEPDRVYPEAITAWIPIDKALAKDGLQVLYFKQSEPDQGWHDARGVVGFLETTEFQRIVDAIGQHYLGIQVRHGGIVSIVGTDE